MGRFIVVEINDNEAKLLQVATTKKGAPTVEVAFAVDFADIEKGDGAAEAKATRFKDAVKNNKVTTAAQCALLIPKQQSIVRLASLPSQDPEELESMALFETEKFIPFNAERHIISSAVMSPEGDENSLVLLTAVDSPVMESAINVVTQSGLQPRIAEVSSIALTRAFLHEKLEPTAEGTNLLEGPILLINVGRLNVDVTILNNGMLVTSRSQVSGIDKMTQLSGEIDKSAANAEATGTLIGGSPWIGKLTKFIRQTVDFALREYGVPLPRRIYATGEALQLEGFTDNLTKSLGAQVQAYDPLVSIQRLAPVSADTLSSYSNAWGTILRLIDEEEQHPSASDRINLLPPMFLEQQEASERKMLLVVSACMIFITGVLLFLVFQTQNAHNKQLEETYRNYNRLMAREVDSLDEKREQLEIIAAVKTDRTPALAILDRISTYPNLGTTLSGGRISLTEFSYSVSDDFTIRGMALDIADINAFVEFLSAMEWNDRPIFREIGTPQYQAFTGLGRDRQVQSFTINCKLNETVEERERRP